MYSLENIILHIKVIKKSGTQKNISKLTNAIAFLLDINL